MGVSDGHCPYSETVTEYGECPSDTLCYNTDNLYTTK